MLKFQSLFPKKLWIQKVKIKLLINKKSIKTIVIFQLT